MPKRLKVLISCYACSPYRGSEPGMGWHFVKGISEFHEVHVITEEVKWKKDLIAYLDKFPELQANLKFYFIPKFRAKKLRKIWPPSYYWFYKKWQKKAYQLALELDKKEGFDLIHQLNMVGFREPGYLWKMKKPFVWGPIGGMENTSFKLLFNLNINGYLYYGLRNIINTIHKIFLPRPRMAAKKSKSSLISATKKNKDDIKKYWQSESVIISEVGCQDNNYVDLQKRNSNDSLRIIWCGQHTGGKALNILLRSLALLDPSIDWQLEVLGEGEMTESWMNIAEKYNLNNRIKWYGWINKEDVLSIMNSGHLLCITSIKDLTSTVTLEALSVGLPIISIDHCGFSHVINDSCGIKIPISYPKKLRVSFADAIIKLSLNEEMRCELGRGAIERSKEFTWDKKIIKINSIYRSLLES